MEWDQFKSLISKLERDGEYKFCLLISVGVFTGLRVSDLLQLKFNQFIGTEFLNIIEKKTKKDKKSGDYILKTSVYSLVPAKRFAKGLPGEIEFL